MELPGTEGGHSVSMSRPSLLDLGPDASDVTEEVDYMSKEESETPAS